MNIYDDASNSGDHENEREVAERVPSSLALWTAEQLLEMPAEAEPFLVENFLPSIGYYVLAADSDSGKTCLTLTMALSIARGETFAGMACCQGPVLWLDYEMGRRKFADQMRLAGGKASDAIHYHDSSVNNLGIWDDSRGYESIRLAVSEIKPRLVVVDSLVGSVGRCDLAKQMEARGATKNFSRLSRDFEVAVWVLAHFNKQYQSGGRPQRLADSMQIRAVSDGTWGLTMKPIDDGQYQLDLIGMGRGDFIQNKKIRLLSKGLGDYRISEHTTVKREHNRSSGTMGAKILAQLEQGSATADSIAKAIRSKPDSVARRLTDLVTSGHVKQVGKDGRAFVYALGQQNFAALAA